jgi:hypothetical protein
MAFEHVVLIKFPEEITPAERAWMDGLIGSWPEAIGGMESLRWGWDVSGRSRGYQFGIVIAFVSEEAAQHYHPHPRHQEFAKWVAGKGAEVLAFDFPVTAGQARER